MAFHVASGTGDEMHATQHCINSRKRKYPVSGKSTDIRCHHTSEGTTWEAEIRHFEKEAYKAVLRAFKIQAETISWEKESLMSNLRQELRMSNEEHREILGKISMESGNQRMRESRHPCNELNGIINARNMNYDIVLHTTGKDPLSKQSITPSVVRQESFGMPSPSPLQSSRRLGLINAEKHKSVVKGMTDKQASSGPNKKGKGAFTASSNNFTNKTSGLPKHYYLLGKKVRIRWPNEQNFCDAVVTRYNPAQGLHALSYNVPFSKDNLKWVDLTKISPDDIQWVSDDNPEMTTVPHSISPHGTDTSLACKSCNISVGRSIQVPKSRSKPECFNVPASPGQDELQIKIRKTDDLLETVNRVFSAGGVDPYTVSLAKEALKKHEKALIQVLEHLADISDDE